MTALKYFLVLAIVIPSLAFSQKAPGYLGKRFSLEYNAFLFPSFRNPNSDEFNVPDDSDIGQKGVSMNFQHNLVGQWSFSKRSSLVGNIGFVSTNYLPLTSLNSNVIVDAYPSMNAINFDAGMRIFFQHYAPLGKYFEFRIGVASVSTADYDYGLVFRNTLGNIDTATVTIGGGTKTLPTIAIAWGVNRIINDKFIISYGFDVKMFPGGLGYNMTLLTDAPRNDFIPDEGNSADNQKELLNMAAGRYAMHCALNLRVGIGILL